MASESFQFWQNKGKSSAKIYLVKMGNRKKTKKRKYGDYDTSSDESDVESAYGRSGNTTLAGVSSDPSTGVSSDPSTGVSSDPYSGDTSSPLTKEASSVTTKGPSGKDDEELQMLRKTMMEDDCAGTYYHDVHTKVRNNEIQRLRGEINTIRDSALTSDQGGVIDIGDDDATYTAPTMENILSPLKCSLCDDFMVEPQQCPKCRMVCGSTC